MLPQSSGQKSSTAGAWWIVTDVSKEPEEDLEPEDGGSKLLRNFDYHVSDYTA
jgi:hypothetical protein